MIPCDFPISVVSFSGRERKNEGQGQPFQDRFYYDYVEPSLSSKVKRAKDYNDPSRSEGKVWVGLCPRCRPTSQEESPDSGRNTL